MTNRKKLSAASWLFERMGGFRIWYNSDMGYEKGHSVGSSTGGGAAGWIAASFILGTVAFFSYLTAAESGGCRCRTVGNFLPQRTQRTQREKMCRKTVGRARRYHPNAVSRVSGR